jgi:Flp pilus assembly protein CpaB
LRQPSWTDARLVAGVLMVLLAVLGGAAVVSAADRSVQVWAVRRALPAGTTLQRDDVTARRVRLFGDDLTRYVGVASGSPEGRVLTRDLGEGDLLPVSALASAATKPATRVVGIPLDRAHAVGGSVDHGDRVDVLATRKTAGGSQTVAVLRNVLVVDVERPSGGFGAGRSELVVLVEVAPGQVLALANAIRTAEIDLSLVVAGSDGTGDVPTAQPTP